jgi:hypothetical protein
LQGDRRDGARTARALKLHFDDAGVVVDLDDGEIASVGLHRRAHEIEEVVELCTAPFALCSAYRPV